MDFDNELGIPTLEKLISILQGPTGGTREYSARLAKGLELDVTSKESVGSTIRWLESARVALDGMSSFIAEEIASLQSRSVRKTGIEDVPEEILLSIMEYSVSADWPPRPWTLTHWKGVVPLSCVCRQFRSVALRSPNLWTYISTMCSIDQTRLFLKRSEGQHLKIHLRHAMEKNMYLSTPAFLAVVLEHRHRWKSFEIELDSRYRQDEYRRFLSSVSSLHGHQSFPALETFEIRSSRPWSGQGELDRVVHFYKEWECPKLGVVILGDLIPEQAAILARPLRVLELSHMCHDLTRKELDTIFDMLRSQPGLERLKISTNVSEWDDVGRNLLELRKLSALELEFGVDDTGLRNLGMILPYLSISSVIRLDLRIRTSRTIDMTSIERWIEVAISSFGARTKVKTVNVEIVCIISYDKSCGFENILRLPNLSHLSIAFETDPSYQMELWGLTIKPSRSLRTVRLSGVESFSEDGLVRLLESENMDDFQKLEVVRRPYLVMEDDKWMLHRSKIEVI